MPSIYFVYAEIGLDDRVVPDSNFKASKLCKDFTTRSSLESVLTVQHNPRNAQDFVFLVPTEPVKYAPHKTFWDRVRGLARVQYEGGDWFLWEDEEPPSIVANAKLGYIAVFVVPMAQHDKLNEERDKVTELRQIAFAGRKKQSPSTEADPKEFRKLVNAGELTFRFGRQMNASLGMLPVSLFQPEFGQFQDDIRHGPVDYHLQPLAWRFCRELEALFEKEKDRENCLHGLLTELFGAEVAKQKIGSYMTHGGIEDAPFNLHPAMPLLIEVKVETTIGSADAAFENLLYYESAVQMVLNSDKTQTLRDLKQSRMPSILIIHNGPNFQVSGGIWASKGQVEVLSPAMALDFNSLDIRAKEDWLRFLTAIHRLFGSMRDIYRNLSRHAVVDSQLEFPYPHDYTPNIGDTSSHQAPVPFIYLERSSDTRLVFTASTMTGPRATDEAVEPNLIVKFVTSDRYGTEAHRIAAKAGIAPKLLSSTPLPGALRMVVMNLLPADFVACSELDTLPAGARKAIDETVARFHALGLVHGDLRATNVFVREAGNGLWDCQLIDFDWAGPIAGEGVKYPIGVYSSESVWRPKQVMVGKITVEHDLLTVKNFFDEFI